MKRICAVLMAVMLMIFAVMPAFATDKVISPSAEDQYDIVIMNTNGGSGSYTTEVKEIDGKKYVTLTAEAKDGFVFTHWDIVGEYTIVEGSLEDEELVIILESDCEATPHFEGAPVITPTQNTGSVSPQTSDNSSYVFLFLGLFIAVAGATAIKLAKSKK